MTTLIIKSDSEEKTMLLTRLANELGLDAFEQNLSELDIAAMVNGIGRKATNEELMIYLAKEADVAPISLEDAFSKYLAEQ